MRKLLSSIILGIALIASCTDYKEPAGKPSSLSVDGSALTFEPGAGSQVFTVSSGEEWQLSALPGWLSVNTIETSGSSPFSWNVTVSATANNSESAREADISISTEKESKVLKVRQKGKTGDIVGPVNPDRPDFVEPSTVDLGLPSGVLWANFNVGAASPEEKGVYYAWGEVETKQTFTWQNYKWGGKDSFSKYNASDKLEHLDPSDDIASFAYGSDWRMPTRAELEELEAKCTFAWKTVNGVKGCQVTGPNGNGIFLPAVGVVAEDGLSGDGSYGYYWSSSLSEGDRNYASRLIAQSSTFSTANAYRYFGMQVRAVRSSSAPPENVPVSGVSLSEHSLSMQLGDVVNLVCTVSPKNATDKSVTWSSSDPSVASVDDGGVVHAKASGSATVIVTTVDGGFSDSCTVTVQSMPIPQAVDLGLSVKWASFNVGASSPEDCGGYYAWGEVSVKDEYDWGTYLWCDGWYNKMTKYNQEDSWGIVDNKTTLDPEDDVAHVMYGGKWRIPTLSELEELMDSANCSWNWTSINGVAGYKVVSRKSGYTDNWIFIPAAGYYGSSSIGNKGTFGYLWSRELRTDYPQYALSIFFKSSSYDAGTGLDRCDGNSVRAVTD